MAVFVECRDKRGASFKPPARRERIDCRPQRKYALFVHIDCRAEALIALLIASLDCSDTSGAVSDPTSKVPVEGVSADTALAGIDREF